MLRRAIANALLLGLLHAASPAAQTAPQQPAPASFDVASIRPTPPDRTGFSINPNPDTFRVSGTTLKFLVQYAYDLDDYQIKGGPAWAATAHFDITAKSDPAPPPAKTREEREKLLQQRLQTLLKDRFDLKVHTETKLLLGFALIVGKTGLKMHPAKPEGGYTTSQGLLVCNDFAMSDLAAELASILRRPVIDRTQDPGHYSFTLKWSPDDSNPTSDAPAVLFTAIQEQLGLKLEPAKVPATILTIDSATQPTAN